MIFEGPGAKMSLRHKDISKFFDLYIVCYQENKSNPCELVGVQKQKNDFPRSSVIFKNGHISAIF